MRALTTVALGALLTAACGPGPTEAPWTDASETISLHAFGPFQGLSGYERDRARLTAEQLELLAALEVRAPAAACGTDQLGYWITITDSTGAAREYHATQYDQECGESGPFIAMSSLQPFLDTFACISSRDPPPGVPVIHPGDGCRHGFYMDGRGTVARAALQVDAPGELSIAVEAGATFAPHLTLLDVDGATTLAEGSSSLTQAFAAAGTFVLEVASTNDVHGDLLLQVR
jgi:hypothetical protein